LDLPRSRYVLTARRQLSVPPDVMTPHASSSPWNSSDVTRSTSLSKRLRLLNAVGLRPLAEKYLS